MRIFSTLVAAVVATQAQAFTPTRPIEVVVHTGPGGGRDLLARAAVLMIEKEKLVPVRMQVVNKTGGGSTVAAAYLYEKKGDPHTIGFFTGVWLTSPITTAEAKVTLRDLGKRDPSRQAGYAQARRGCRVQTSGHGRGCGLGQHGIFGMRAVGARIGNAGDERAVRLARAIAAERPGERQRKDACQHAAAHLPVDRIDARRFHLHPQLPGPGTRRGHILQAHHLRPAVAMNAQRPHDVQRTILTPASCRMPRIWPLNSS